MARSGFEWLHAHQLPGNATPGTLRSAHDPSVARCASLFRESRTIQSRIIEHKSLAKHIRETHLPGHYASRFTHRVSMRRLRRAEESDGDQERDGFSGVGGWAMI